MRPTGPIDQMRWAERRTTMHWVTAGRSCQVGRSILRPQVRRLLRPIWREGGCGHLHHARRIAGAGRRARWRWRAIISDLPARLGMRELRRWCGGGLGRRLPPGAFLAGRSGWRRRAPFCPVMTEQACHLLAHGFFVGGSEHASGIMSVLLERIAWPTYWDTSLVENDLHSLKYILSARSGCGIGVLLATITTSTILPNFIGARSLDFGYC